MALNILNSFLKEFINQDENYTHATFANNGENYHIPRDRYEDFMQLYCNVIIEGDQPQMSEVPLDVSSVSIRLTFVQESKKRVYRKKHIEAFIEAYNNILIKYLKLTTSSLDAYVFEREQLQDKDGNFIDEVVIRYPCIITYARFRGLFRQNMLKKMNKIFGKIPLAGKQKHEDIFDKTSICGNMLMYLSREDPEDDIFELTHLYQYKDGSINDKFKEKMLKKESFITNIVKNTALRRHGRKDITPFNEEHNETVMDAEVDNMQQKLLNEGGQDDINILLGENARFIRKASPQLLEEAKLLIGMINTERCMDKYEREQIGMCLHNIDFRLLPQWIKFCTRAEVDPSEMKEDWNKFTLNGYSIATLYDKARHDAPVEFEKFREEAIDKALQIAAASGSENDLALALLETVKHQYVCADISSRAWYQFYNHKWQRVDSAYTLLNHISDDLGCRYKIMMKDIGHKLADATSDDVKLILEARKKSLKDLISKLGKHNFKKNVLAEAANRCYDPDFFSELNENHYIIGFENGVYDLKAMKFRDGCPDDKRTLSVGYDYVKLGKGDTNLKKVKKFLMEIYPEDSKKGFEMYKYMLRVFASCLSGSIEEACFFILIGGGANGKSVVMDLLQAAFGGYYCELEIKEIVGKRSAAGAASPGFADKKGIRITSSNEPDGGETLNIGLVKAMTSDKITARGLYQSNFSFKPQFKPFMLCNNKPKIEDMTDGAWRRLKVIDHVSKFYMKDDPKLLAFNGVLPPNVHLADKKISEKVKDWNLATMTLLLEAYAEYIEMGSLGHPQSVIQSTESYRQECDYFGDFMHESYNNTCSNKDKLKIKDLYANFKGWYRGTHDAKCPDFKTFKIYFTGKPEYNLDAKTGIIRGWTLANEDDLMGEDEE